MRSVPTYARSVAILGALIAVVLPGVASAHDPEPPRVKAPTSAFSGITATLAKLSAIVDPRDSATTVHFEIGRTTSYGFNTQEKSIPYVTDPVQVWISIYGLAPLTRYHFRAVAKNATGTTVGPDQSFITLLGTGTEALTDLAPGASAPSPLDVATPFGTTTTDPLNTTPLPGTATTAGAPTGTSTSSAATSVVPVLVPEQSQTVVVQELTGAITWRRPGGTTFQGMTGVDTIPVGAVVDARNGTVGLSVDAGTGIDSGKFWGAIFEVRQSKQTGGVTELALRSGRPKNCGRGGRTARSAASRDKKGLWGKDRGGHFRTRGRNSVAAVRGTVWYVAERCAGTLTRVVEGAVEVRDMHRGTKTILKAGHHMMVRDR